MRKKNNSHRQKSFIFDDEDNTSLNFTDKNFYIRLESSSLSSITFYPYVRDDIEKLIAELSNNVSSSNT